jgi:putative transcriptional regulator
MDKELFDQRQRCPGDEAPFRGKAVRGARTTEPNEPDIRAIREAAKASQSQFAKRIGVSVRTLQNWERQRTDPAGLASAAIRGCTLVLSAISNRYDPCNHQDRSLASAAALVAN